MKSNRTGLSMLRRGAALGLCLALAAGLAAAADLPDPRKPGPYPVGVTTTFFVDHSRTDKITKGTRTLPTEIWYPATDETRGMPPNKFSDFFFRGVVPELDGALKRFFERGLDEVDINFKNFSVRDARMRDGLFPLIVFSHGNGGVRAQNAYWCEHMASHGFVVMAPDHTGNCAATYVDGKVIPYNVGGMMGSAKERPLDVSFLITEMARMNSGEDSRFAGRIDMENIGVAGHSFGGYTSAAVVEIDDRVDAINPMTPVWPPMRKNYSTPLLQYLATEDRTIGLEGNSRARKKYEESTGPRYQIEIPDGGHFTFTEMFQVAPDFGDGIGTGKRITIRDEPITYLPMEDSFEIANAYSLAFFSIYLKGKNGYRDFLIKNHYGDKILHDYVEPEAAQPRQEAAGASN